MYGNILRIGACQHMKKIWHVKTKKNKKNIDMIWDRPHSKAKSCFIQFNYKSYFIKTLSNLNSFCIILIKFIPITIALNPTIANYT